MADHTTQFEPIGQAFVKHYYTLFDNPQTRTENLISLYLQQGCFQTFEGSQAAGVEAIKAKLASKSVLENQLGKTPGIVAVDLLVYITVHHAVGVPASSLSFQRIQRSITSVDCQPLQDGILVVVLGQLKTDEDQVQSYNETFVLRAASGNFFITNNIFRLVLHHM